MEMELYKWQKNCLRAWEEHRFHGMVHAVTGAGKTVFALAAIELLRQRYPDLRVKVVVPTIALAQQWQTALLHRAACEELRPGFFGGGVRDTPDKPTILYVINSARGALASHVSRDLALGRHVLLICDECHHYQAPQNRRIFNFLQVLPAADGLYHSLGLSATPLEQEPNSILVRALGPEIYSYGFDDAALEGVVSPFTVCEISAPFFPDELNTYEELNEQIRRLTGKLYSAHPHLKDLGRERFLREVQALAQHAEMDPEDPAAAFLLAVYRRKEVSHLARARVRCGQAVLERLAPTDRVLVFCERIEQLKAMAESIRQRGGVCGTYHSKLTKEARSRNLREFREGRARILVSCRSLDEGLDVPDANIAIVLSSSSTQRQRIQRLGRVLRPAPGKESACLYFIYIRESAEDTAYLRGDSPYRCFSMRYYSAEDDFSNDLYEYAASQLLRRAQRKGLPQDQLSELRRCFRAGLARPDYLLPAETLESNRSRAKTKGERNYWNAMAAIRKTYFAEVIQSDTDANDRSSIL